VIIFFFVGVNYISSAINVNKNKENNLFINYVEHITDTENEILTIISGVCLSYDIHNNGLIRNVTIWGLSDSIDIEGWKYPLFTHFFERATVIHTSKFIGYFYEHPWGGDYTVKGIAIGNIEWT
jgi:hypothetical protein